MQSEQINELALALSKAQAAIGGAIKDSANQFFKSRYADLQAIYDAVKEPLAKNCLAVVQLPRVEAGVVTLVTTIIHSSGQWISGEYPISPVKADPQGYGSALTYARRYSLQSMLGVPAVDDDGEAAMGRTAAPSRVIPTTLSRATESLAGHSSKTEVDVEHEGKATSLCLSLSAVETLDGLQRWKEANAATMMALPEGPRNRVIEAGKDLAATIKAEALKKPQPSAKPRKKRSDEQPTLPDTDICEACNDVGGNHVSGCPNEPRKYKGQD